MGCPLTVHMSLGDLGMGQTAGTEAYRWDSTGEEWERHLGQRPVKVLSLSIHPSGTEACSRGLHRMSSHCPYTPWGLRDVMESQDRGRYYGNSTGCSLTVRTFFRTEGWDGQLGQRATEGPHGIVTYILLSPTPQDSWESQIPLGQLMAILDNPRRRWQSIACCEQCIHTSLVGSTGHKHHLFIQHCFLFPFTPNFRISRQHYRNHSLPVYTQSSQCPHLLRFLLTVKRIITKHLIKQMCKLQVKLISKL